MSAVPVALGIIVLAAIFLPVIPHTQSSSWFYGLGNNTVEADVSLTFLLVHCGAYINANSTSTVLEVGASSPGPKGYNFNCNFRVT